MIRFTLFGVQVSIHPTLWLTLAILGRAYCVSSVVELMSALLFIVSAFVILLAHEMGHALVGRRLGGAGLVAGIPVFTWPGWGATARMRQPASPACRVW